MNRKTVAYHKGRLPADPSDDPALDRLATSVLTLRTKGKVALFQRRVGGDQYEYLAHLATAAA